MDGGTVPADEVVTQTGHVGVKHGHWQRLNFSFRSSLRTQRNETYMSAIRGRLTVVEAVPLVSRGDCAGEADAVRYASVEKLRDAGFEVKFKPSRTIPDHVAITYPDEWAEDVARRFGECFKECIPGERGE